VSEEYARPHGTVAMVLDGSMEDTADCCLDRVDGAKVNKGAKHSPGKDDCAKDQLDAFVNGSVREGHKTSSLQQDKPADVEAPTRMAEPSSNDTVHSRSNPREVTVTGQEYISTAGLDRDGEDADVGSTMRLAVNGAALQAKYAGVIAEAMQHPKLEEVERIIAERNKAKFIKEGR
jgi:hypothetical protein